MAMADNKPGTLHGTFGIPPATIREYILMEYREDEGVIEFLHSDLISKNDMALRNYVKAATNIASHKFPTLKIKTTSVPAQEFDKMDRSSVQTETNESSKIQSDVILLINQCAKLGASDIHIDTHMNESIIRARINGDLIIFRRIVKELSAKYISVIYNTLCEVAESMYTGMEFQDAVFRRSALPANLSGVRVACGPSMNGPFMVLRLLYKENIRLDGKVHPLIQLGYTEEQKNTMEILKAQPSGIILIAGPTGSGKSTTLKYAIQDMARNTGINFISIEDPPEYNIRGVRQMPVSVKSNDDDRDAAFGKTIRSALRSDPDKIMIGEIRDAASAIMAITCAQTGHQVWTTLHANGTFTILSRLLGLLVGPKYSERQAISVLSDPTIINGLMFQRLVPVLCPHCRVPLKDHEELLNEVEYASLCRSLMEKYMITDPDTGLVNERETHRLIEEAVREKVYLVNSRPKEKCPHCVNGVKGRMVVAELVYTNQQLLDDMFSHSAIYAKRRWNAQNKDQTIQANARKLIMSGLLDPRDAIATIGLLEADIGEREE